MNLSNRELKAEDIPFIIQYWERVTPDDIKRMYIDPSLLQTHMSTQNERLQKTLQTPISERSSDPLIWELDGKAIGLTNLNNIVRGEQASIHLHVWDRVNRGKGYGRVLFMMSVRKYFDRHQLQKLICEPAPTNKSPNGLMHALGIPITKTYTTKTASVICLEHEVNRYEIDKAWVHEMGSTDARR